MFKKIQNHLLLHQPLLWNLKIVPVFAAAVIIHIILFIMGYCSGTIDFSNTGNDYLPDGKFALIVFFCVVTALFTIIIWLVFYLRNNSFKSLYPKSHGSLFKEWLLILFICLINGSYPLTYFYASNLRATSYFESEEFNRRIDIMSMASIFAGDNFNMMDNAEYDTIKGDLVNTNKCRYFGRLYYRHSLLNKAMHDFPNNDFKKDSVLEYRAKRWLHDGRKDSLLWLMQQTDKIVKYHDLKATITPQQWLDKIYNAPEFIKYADIHTKEYYIVNLNPDRYDELNYDYETGEYAAAKMLPDTVITKTVGDSLVISNKHDTISLNILENDIKMIKGIRYVYPKNVIPLDKLEDAYGEISRAYSDRDTGLGVALCLLYFCFTLSALILSFRVTSGRNWLIALVSFGISAIITGIVFVFIDETIGYPLRRFTGQGYLLLWIGVEITLLLIFFFVKKKKGITAILLNVAAWLLPWLLPAIAGVIVSIYEDYYNLYYHERPLIYQTLRTYTFALAIMFIIIHFIAMYFFTKRIKQWKGIPEG